MRPSPDGDDDYAGAPCGSNLCGPPTPSSTVGTLFSLSPFIVTFVAVASISATRLFPLLAKLQQRTSASNSGGIDDGEDHFLPMSAPPSLRQAHAEHAKKSPRRKMAAATFSATIALSAVLAELILAEILEAVPEARGIALKITVPTLLILLVGVIPFLEVQSVVGESLGLRFTRDRKGKIPRFAWGLQMVVFSLWLIGFWYVGEFVTGADDGKVMAMYRLAKKTTTIGFDATAMTIGRAAAVAPDGVQNTNVNTEGGLARACLERIGVIGIFSMALLSGFASVSSPWHIFADKRSYKRRPITDVDIARKQAGLEATSELLLTKKHRLRSLQRKAQAVAEGIGQGAGGSSPGETGGGGSSSGLVGKMLGSLKTITGSGSAEAAEIKALQVEISGLETMESNLAGSLASLKARQAAHARDGTALGKLIAIPQYAFAMYCVYRVLATILTTVKRSLSSYPTSSYSPSFSSSDPISRFLGLIAKHWDPKLDQLAWARQISFLLSGVILAASANSVLQTFRLFSKWAPGLLYQAQANLALLVGQIAATYVISAALLLRSSLPKEVGRSVGDALESALEPGFVDRWFEGWFLLASLMTALGIWIGRKVSGGFEGEEWDEFGGEEMGVGQKRS
ncbi:Abscisic acid G-protein coupled receptor-domain-containing protein [Podospora australis]|uniref:Abscisic acid G-protein coupled receptor-domain-containing protein n=1 Tax=Podospora australis TaxID=1536484 RepID=A0AAN6WWK7_9PEZI|nr:Abscisic acid G-protein coupled receptor-domain-containing protein [Podospora australis]